MHATTPPPRSRTRPARALARVLRAPGFVLALWLAQLLFAKLFAAPTRSAANAGLGSGAWFDDGHRLRALIELFLVEPAIVGTIVAALTSSAILAAVFSVIAAPAMLTRLAGERSAAAVLGSIGSKLPAMLVQTGYGLVFRAICTGLAAIPAATLGLAGAPLVLLVGSFPVLVLDRARAAVTLDGARPYHPMTLLRAVVDVGKRPLAWLTGAALEAARLSVGIGALILVLQAETGGSIWIARLAGLLAVVLGLWRVALAVDARTQAERGEPQ